MDQGLLEGLAANNGKYDAWNGPHQIHIFVGRVPANIPALGKSEEVITKYLKKLLAFKSQSGSSCSKVLGYNDEDWSGLIAAQDSIDLELLCDSPLVIADSLPEGNTVTAEDYRENQMKKDYLYVSLRSHGNPEGHGFYENNRSMFNMVNNSDYVAILPKAPFYHLYICSAANFLYDNFIAGTIAMEKYGLLTVSSSKTGGMWYKENVYYAALSEGKTFGEAFLQWMNFVLSEYPDGFGMAFQWFGGQIITGDPTLTLK